MKKIYSIFLLLIFYLFLSTPVFSQNHIGLSTGNYSGVSSLWFNPSSIVDSRHKFDINLISINSYFDNNLFDVRRDAVLRQRFFKEPYSNSYDAVRRDLLRLTPGMRNEPVNMYVDSKIQYPLSMMFTVGKKSALALNFQSRMGMRGDNINRSTATLLYRELNDPAQYNMVQDNSGINFNYLRWQEAGLTYGTVLLNSKAHFLKGAFTGKWLMGQSAAHIKSDNVQVTFQSAQQLSLQSPLIRYYRTDNADVQSIGLNSFFRDIEDNQFGWDVGLTYEFRGKFKKFKYVGENNEVRERRDLNKYAFRLGVALLDVGKFNFRKQRLTNDHSANINNFNFGNVKANNFDEWDTAYSKRVNYLPNASNSFEMSLPTALSANLDVHLFRGFYVNAAMYSPVESITSRSQTTLRAVKWYAVTPRVETRHFGLYVPVVATPLNDRTTVGATVRLGPVYVGSSNLGNYIFNDKLATIDVHAGVKLGITYGRPNRIMRSLNSLINRQPNKDEIAFRDTSRLYADYRKALDSIRNLNTTTNKNNNQQDQRAPMVNVIVNNYLSGAPGVMAGQTTTRDSIIINNPVAVPQGASAMPVDTAVQRKNAEIEFLLRRIAESEMRLKKLEQKRVADSIEAAGRTGAPKTTPSKKPVGTTNAPGAAKTNQPAAARENVAVQQPATTVVQQPAMQQPSTIIVQQPAPAAPRSNTRIIQRPVVQPNTPAVVTVQQPANNNSAQLDRLNDQNNDLEEQVRALRTEMANATNATNEAIRKSNRIDTVTTIIRDTTVVVDTILMDTIRILNHLDRNVAVSPVQPEYIPIYFATGSNALSPAGIRVLERVVNDFQKNNNYTIHLTGRTDSMGAPEVNRRLAQKRIDAVTAYLARLGLPREKITYETQPELSGNPRPNAENRRVDIEIRNI